LTEPGRILTQPTDCISKRNRATSTVAEVAQHGDGNVTNALLKTAFVLIVMLLTIALIVPPMLALEILLPTERGGDRLLPGVIVAFACLWAADRITSLLFWKTHVSDERWSILDSRGWRRLN
jgi:hypothetical protein